MAAAEIAEMTGVPHHDIALTLGSGWAKAADLIGETTATIPATDITRLLGSGAGRPRGLAALGAAASAASAPW